MGNGKLFKKLGLVTIKEYIFIRNVFTSLGRKVIRVKKKKTIIPLSSYDRNVVK